MLKNVFNDIQFFKTYIQSLEKFSDDKYLLQFDKYIEMIEPEIKEYSL